METESNNPVFALVSGMLPTPMAATNLHSIQDIRSSDTLLCGSAGRQEGLEQQVPLLPHFYHGEDPNLHLLHIKYINTPGDLQRISSCLHMHQGAYSAIVIEEINSLVRGEDRNTLIRMLAMLLEGVRAYRACSGAGGNRCPLLVTDSSDDARRPRYIYDRWLPTTILLSPSATPRGPDGCFVLTVISSGVQNGIDSQTSTATLDLSEGATLPCRLYTQCWYRVSGARLLLEAIKGPDLQAALLGSTARATVQPDQGCQVSMVMG
ncbi:hypothetical protein Vretimale_4729 [Volvox reticuliferus]|uniref:ATPase AAA-type core domain-containing protein n=2 Tax=Volvox reticuliferus TaxID=1737510 RepID=A0A8J4G1P2_9CHLO|nr:hypothetical protein Vretifemale_3329 [Volvox reticuliferus]GIL99590.1 hypothetical protein Vretimale_4729 [Volvox reticuliferus]